jgi:hypothetical protein
MKGDVREKPVRKFLVNPSPLDDLIIVPEVAAHVQ